METAHLPNGTLLQGGKYKIVRFIGSGGFGCTYEGEHTMLGSKVAIKEFFVRDFCNREETTSHVTVGITEKKGLVEKLKKKFVDEARFTAGLRHPNIARVSDVFEENGTAYYVMDFMDGPSLDKLVKTGGPMDEDRALKYIQQVASALAYVHNHNRLHLDVKPGNIMTDAEDNAILIDFGASKQYDEVDGENTSTLMGKTPGYAPIEQMGNTVTTFTPATDIYALGATLYKLLTGNTPIEATRLASGEELAPLPSNISTSTATAVSAAMRAGRKDRPQSVAEFLALLDFAKVVSTTPAQNKFAGAKTTSEETVLEDSLEKQQSNFPTESEKRPTIEIGHPQKLNFRKEVKILAVVLCVIAIIVGMVLFTTRTPKENFYSEPVSNQVENGHEYVDLGLSVNWATCNVGASSPSGYGNYYAWGELTPKYEYTNRNSVTYNKNFKDIAGNPEYDTASSNWGGAWRMPTEKEMDELFIYCTWEWQNIEGINGYHVTGPNGNSIFLPAAGWRDDFNNSSRPPRNMGSSGHYLSATSSRIGSMNVCSLFFDKNRHEKAEYSRSEGQSVRPVLPMNLPIDSTIFTTSEALSETSSPNSSPLQTSTQTSTSSSFANSTSSSTSSSGNTTTQTNSSTSVPSTPSTPAALDASSLLSGSGEDTDNKYGSARKKRK